MNDRGATNVSSEITELKIEGMSCNHCQKAVEEALGGVAGVEHVEVDLEGGRARVRGGDPQALISAVDHEGYRAAALP